MAGTTLNLSVVEKRMLSATEAAHYCGLAVRHFKTLCPVPPVELGGKHQLFDKRDLDQWIDGEKTGLADVSHDAILGRLG